jgi:hypothetical protein
MKKADRIKIFNKYNGLCAFSGTPLEDDWQIEHIEPVRRNIKQAGCLCPENDCFENMIPVQKLINHYKHSLTLEEFRNWYLGNLHLTLKKLPKNPRTEKSIKRIAYILEIANYFGITEDKPFDKIFYFERLK